MQIINYSPVQTGDCYANVLIVICSRSKVNKTFQRILKKRFHAKLHAWLKSSTTLYCVTRHKVIKSHDNDRKQHIKKPRITQRFRQNVKCKQLFFLTPITVTLNGIIAARQNATNASLVLQARSRYFRHYYYAKKLRLNPIIQRRKH